MTNLAALEQVAEALGPLRDEVVFVGGSVRGLLVTDTAAPPERPADDVDAIVEVASRGAYYAFTRRLRGCGPDEDPSFALARRPWPGSLTRTAATTERLR